MFEEVGQTLLIVLLLDCANVVNDVEVGQTLLLVVVTQIVAHTVL
jgi:hypothetical protein